MIALDKYFSNHRHPYCRKFYPRFSIVIVIDNHMSRFLTFGESIFLHNPELSHFPIGEHARTP